MRHGCVKHLRKNAGGTAFKFPFSATITKELVGKREERRCVGYCGLFFSESRKTLEFCGTRTHHGSMVSSMFSLLWPHRAAFDH